MIFNKLKKGDNKGFSLVELIVVIAVMAVLLSVLAPSLLSYVERSRAQKDDSAMNEVTNAIKLAMADQDVYDELLQYNELANVSGFADEVTDETSWTPTGTMRGVTITFTPTDNVIALADGQINALMEKPTKTGKIGDALCNSTRVAVGDEVELTSQTYRNSPYTVFVSMGSLGGNDLTAANAVNVYGVWGGTNRTADSGSGEIEDPTDPTEEPEIDVNGLAAGLYETGSNYAILKTSWQDLLDEGVVHVTDDGVVYTNFDMDTSTNSSSDALSGDLILPYGITALGDFDTSTGTGNVAFAACAELTGIKIQESVTNIGYGAFFDCINLISVEIPDSVTTIDQMTFACCVSLRNITIPNSITAIGDGAFDMCPNLVTVFNYSTLPLQIGSKEYGGVSSSAYKIVDADGNITYPDKTWIETEDNFLVTYHDGIYALHAYCGTENIVTLPQKINGCDYLPLDFRGASKIVIPFVPDGFINVFSEVFKECEGLMEVTIGNGVTTITESAFEWCDFLMSVNIPDGVIEIGKSAFLWCNNLRSIHIPNSVTNIETYAFYECNSMTSVTFEANSQLTNIGTSAFQDCNVLPSVVIPQSVTDIGDYAFCNSKNLTSIIFEGNVEQWNKINKGTKWNYGTPATEVVCSDGVVSLVD